MRYVLIIVFHSLVGIAAAQIKVDRAIELNSTDPAQRQITGVPSIVAPDAVINAATELNNAHRSSEPAGGALWQIDLQGLDQAPIPGTQLLVRSPAPMNGSLQVMVNEHGPFNVTYGNATNIDGNWIPEGTILSIVFDGNGFQLMNGSPRIPRGCPEGLVAVNEQFCIQVDRSPQQEFWDSIQTCGSQGLRLCSWGEFYSACTDAAVLGLQNMPSVWEWTNNTANEDYGVRIAGNGTCAAAATGIATTGDPSAAKYFRCCFTR